MRHSMSYLRDNEVECIKLDATPEGQFVYEQLGFVAECKFHRWERIADQSSQIICPNQVVSRSGQLDQLDRIAFGADRAAFLNLLDADSFTVSTDDGFGMIRSGRRASYLGPGIADTPNTAEHIVRALVGQSSGRVFWDIPALNTVARAIAEQFGFHVVRDLTRMTLGQMPKTPDFKMQFAIAAPETG